MGKLDPIVAGIAAGVLAVIVIVVGIAWSATNANNYYYSTAAKCIESGAQWLPMGSSAYNGFCIKSGNK